MGPTSPVKKSPDADHLFLETGQDTYSYGDLYRFESGLKTYLKNRGIQKKDPLLLVSGLSSSLVFAIAACWHLRIPFIPLSPQQLEYSLEDIRELSPSHTFVAPGYEKMAPSPASVFNEQFIDRITRKAKDDTPPDISGETTKPDDLFGIFYSSGTGGFPKLIPLKRRQLHYSLNASARDLKPEPDHSWLLCLPPYHIGGTAVILRSLGLGTGIFLQPRFEVERIRKLLSTRTSIQCASLVPTMLRRLLQQKSFQVHHNFRAILLGGGPIDSSLIEWAVQRNIPVINSYGMTETCAQITSNLIDPDNAESQPLDSVGKIFAPNRLQIRSENGHELGSEKTGLIWLKGEQIFDGYLSPTQNKRHFDKDGWFNTGDYGQLDSSGHLYIKMRRTDLIVSGGKNVNPHEVEAELKMWERIRDVAVIGIPDAEWGEKVTAVIITASGYPKPTVEDVKRYLQNRLESYKIPKQVVNQSRLPKTGVGKIRRSVLRKRIEQSSRDNEKSGSPDEDDPDLY